MLKRMVVFAAAMLALGAGTALAAIPNTSDYLHRTTPMISGTVVSVDDQQIVVDTDQGKQVTMVMDSHTMLPVDLAPGMYMRAEFRVMENGQYYVNRITPVREGRNSRHADAYWNGRGQDLDLTRAHATQQDPVPGSSEPMVTAGQPAPAEAAVAADVSAPSNRPEALPQTAGRQPLIALLALLALGGAGAMMLARRSNRG